MTCDFTTKTTSTPVANVLSLDGGGVKGIQQLVILAEIEKRLSKKSSEIFSYVGGTSIGSFNAVAISLPDGDKPKFSALELIEIFEKKAKEIFPHSVWRSIKSLDGLIEAEYPTTGLEKLLVEYVGDTKLNELKSFTVIPSTDWTLPLQRIFIFNQQKYPDLLARQVVRASTAAPTYFGPYTMDINGTPHTFLDGGVMANNPTKLVYDTAKARFSGKLNVCSLGTGYVFTKTTPDDDWGTEQWIKGGRIVNLLFDAQQQLVETQMQEFRNPEDTYVRLNERLPEDHSALDNTKEANIAYLIQAAKQLVEDNEETIEILCKNLEKAI